MMKKELMVKALMKRCDSYFFCESCPLGSEKYNCDFSTLPKSELKKMMKVIGIEAPKTSKEDKLIKQLEKLKEYCHKHSDNNEKFCSECKYNSFCCEVPSEWDMDKIKEKLKK